MAVETRNIGGYSRTTCKQCKKKIQAIYYQNNKAKMKANSAAWGEANQERKKELNKAWYQNNKELAKKRASKWQKQRREEGQLCHKCNEPVFLATFCERHYYQHRSRHATGVVKHWEFVKELLDSNRKCNYCGCLLKTVSLKQIDHIIPRGLHPIDDLTNLQVLCTPCNTHKSDSYDD